MKEKGAWQTLGSVKVYENDWISVREDRIINPSGNKGIYGVVTFKNLAIGVLPLDKDYNTWLVGQYRYPLEKYSWEIPEGGGDVSIPAAESALRELREETGLIASEIQQVLEMDLSNSATTEKAICFVARGIMEGESSPEETEDLAIKKLPFQEVFRMVLNGEITDSLTVATVLKVDWMIREGKL